MKYEPSKERKLIENTFLKHVGSVIRNGRENKHMTQQEFSDVMSVDPSTISRYETGAVDIPASVMAYASYVCGFSLEKYTKTPLNKSLNKMFEELVRFGNTKPVLSKKDRKQIELDYEIIHLQAQRKTEKELDIMPREYMIDGKYLIEYENRFERYIQNEDNADKRQMLEYITAIIEDSKDSNSKDLKTVARAAARYIANSKDHEERRILTYYVEMLKNLG